MPSHVTWLPLGGVNECVVQPTSHLPPEDGNDFWGWHTSRHMRLREACQGQIVGPMVVPPPSCWNYGGWGLRTNFRSNAYTVRGNEGVWLEFNDAKPVLVGSQRAAELADVINAVRQRHAQ